MNKLDFGLKIGLTVVIIGLGYLLYDTLFKPYYFEQRKERQYAEVKDRLLEISAAQKVFRDITGRYAGNWDTLGQVMKFGEVPVIMSLGKMGDTVRYINMATAINMFQIDPTLTGEALHERIRHELRRIDSLIKYENYDSPTIMVQDTSYVAAQDVARISTHPDSLRYIPNGDGRMFSLQANIIPYGPARLPIPVYEVIALNKDILWDENPSRYKPGGGWKLGSMSEPSSEIMEIKP
jgi:hypothetical protein